VTESPVQDELGRRRRPRHVVVYAWGVAILVLGLLSAALIYALVPDDADADADARIASERMYQHNLEVMGGRFAVYADEFDRWFAALWHGKELASTLAVLSTAAGLACIGIARLMSRTSQGGNARS